MPALAALPEEACTSQTPLDKPTGTRHQASVCSKQTLPLCVKRTPEPAHLHKQATVGILRLAQLQSRGLVHLDLHRQTRKVGPEARVTAVAAGSCSLSPRRPGPGRSLRVGLLCRALPAAARAGSGGSSNGQGHLDAVAAGLSATHPGPRSNAAAGPRCRPGRDPSAGADAPLAGARLASLAAAGRGARRSPAGTGGPPGLPTRAGTLEQPGGAPTCAGTPLSCRPSAHALRLLCRPWPGPTLPPALPPSMVMCTLNQAACPHPLCRACVPSSYRDVFPLARLIGCFSWGCPLPPQRGGGCYKFDQPEMG